MVTLAHQQPTAVHVSTPPTFKHDSVKLKRTVPFCMSKSYSHDNFSAPKPECRSDPECPFHLACIQEKCKDPCQTSTCGVNAECKAKNHRAICVCIYGFVGDPYTICEERKNMYNLKEDNFG